MQDERLTKIVTDILRKDPTLSQAQLLNMIAEKKLKVGAGFLTDTGAAYLVANDLGLDL